MTETDAKKIVASLLAAYANYRPPDIKAAAQVWFETMEEYSYEQVSAGLNIYMRSDTKGFPPIPGQIIDKIHTMTAPRELNEMEAWSLVYKAICNSTYNYVSEFEKLPPLVQKAVGLPDSLREWATTQNLNREVVMSNFQRAYRTELQRELEFQKMPHNVRELIAKKNVGSYSVQIEQKRQDMIKSINIGEHGRNEALEAKKKGVPMPDRCVEAMERMRNG